MSWLKIHNVIRTVFSRKTSLIEQAKKNVLGFVVLGVAIGIASPAISLLSSDTASAYPVTQADCTAQSGTWGYIGSEQGCTLPQSTCAAQGGTWGYNGSTLGCTPPSSVAPSSAISGGCSGNGVTTGLTSPFSSTSTMCLGDEASSGRRFYQFIVKLSSAVPVTVTSSSKDMIDNKPIEFIKQSSILYVSKPNSQITGYGAYTIGGTCNESDPSNKVTIHVAGPNNSQDFTINLCSAQYSNQSNASTQSLVYLDATSIKDSSGNSTSTKGTIKGNLGITRTDPLVPEKWKKGTLSSVGIMSISLSGKATISGNGTASWFTLADGMLNIPNLDSGVYTLKIVYNDKLALQALGGDPSWTTSNTLYEFTGVLVPPGGDVWLNSSNETTVWYQDANSDGTDLTKVADQASKVPTSTCSVEGVGWIVCPIINFMADVNNVAYGLIDGMLNTNTRAVATTDPTTNKDTMTYTVWQTMRSFANVGFVIFFLIIIFSQITNLGISNYGLKKLFPRLIVAAILVNVSFFICQIGVDLSNVLGGSLKGLFESIPGYDKAGGVLANGNMIGEILVGTATITAAVGGAIAISAGAGAGILLPVLFAALISVILTLAILAARQVMVILLTIVSPLALLAMLLPNTKNLYKQWQKIFISMLTVYPMIAVLFGASSLASSIIISTAGSDPSAFVPFLLGIMVTFVPLALTPKLLQGSLKAVPILGDMASKLTSKSNAGLSGAVKPIIANQKAKSEAGLDMFGRKRNPAKVLKSIRNRKIPEYQKHTSDQIDADGNILHRKGDLVRDANGSPIPITDADGKQIMANKRRRSWTQVSGDATRNVEKMTESNKAKAKNDWAQRGLNAETGAARNTRSLLDEERDEGLRKSATDSTYDARFEGRKVQDSELRSVNDQLADAKKQSKMFEGQQELRQIRRTQANELSTVAGQVGADGSVRIGDIDRETFRVESATSAGNVAIKTANQASGVANNSIQDEKASKLEGDVLDKEQDALFDVRKNSEADLQTLEEREDAAKRLSETAHKEAELHLEGVADSDEGLKELREQKERAEFGVENIKNKQKSEFEETKLAGGTNADLQAQSIAGKVASERTKAEQDRIENEARLGTNQQDLTNPDGTMFSPEQLAAIKTNDQRTQAQQAASNYASGGKKIGYAKEINNKESDLGKELAVTASGAKYKDDSTGALELDPVTGEPKVDILVYARAAKEVLEDDQGDANTIVSYAKSTSLPVTSALEILGHDPSGKKIPGKDIRNLSVTEMDGYIRYAAGRQDKKTTGTLITIVGELGVEAEEPSKRVAQALKDGVKPEPDDVEIVERARRAQVALQESAGASFPQWVGGTDQQTLSEGRFKYTNEESAIVSLAGGKLSADSFSAMGIDNKVKLAQILTEMPDEKRKSTLKGVAETNATRVLKDKGITEPTDEQMAEQINTEMATMDQNIANAIIAIDKAQFDPLLNKNLEPRDIEQFNTMREMIRTRIAPNVAPMLATGQLDESNNNAPISAPYKGYAASKNLGRGKAPQQSQEQQQPPEYTI
jgi:hypothetical protein